MTAKILQSSNTLSRTYFMYPQIDILSSDQSKQVWLFHNDFIKSSSEPKQRLSMVKLRRWQLYLIYKSRTHEGHWHRFTFICREKRLFLCRWNIAKVSPCLALLLEHFLTELIPDVFAKVSYSPTHTPISNIMKISHLLTFSSRFSSK